MKIRNLFGIALGSSLEWYDFALYGFFVPIFAKYYFPATDSQTAILKAFGLFAVGFLARPFGGIIFGILGDKYGRIKYLKITPILITIPTVLIAFLPTYNSMGILAPILLLLSRIIQGLFISGEYAGNMVYMCESSKTKPYFFGSIASCTGSFGIFLASLTSSALYYFFPSSFVENIGWRIAFLLSIILGFITYRMRQNMPETIDFSQLKQNNQLSTSPLLDAKKEWFPCIIALGILFLHATAFYTVFTFMPSFVSTSNAMVPGLALSYISLFLFIRLWLIPCMGLIAQKFGGKTLMRVSAILFMLFSYPLFAIICSMRLPGAIIAIGIFAFFTAINAGTVPGLLKEVLATKTRYTTFAFTFNLGFGIFGGLAPIILQAIVKDTGTKVHDIWYLVFSAFVTFVATFFIPRGNKYEAVSTNI